MELVPLDAPTPLAVVNSVRNHFPTIRQVEAQRIVASGEVLTAAGAFDHELQGYNNAQPLDFYENYWNKWQLERKTMWGGNVAAGYRIGRGSFEPWYKERETNGGGEFSLALSVPIVRDRDIDQYRAELWRAELERGRVEPVVRAEVIETVRQGVVAYWLWVAAGADLQVAEQVLKLGVDRVAYLKRQVELGAKAEIDEVDNRRAIVSREAKVIEAKRKVRQATAKLSLYLRNDLGEPLLLDAAIAPQAFPKVELPPDEIFAGDTRQALANRPELAELNLAGQQLQVAYRQARNETQPDIDGGLFVAQDVGSPTPADDKSEFELEAILTLEVPLERRKALGKVRQLRGKFAALRAKTQFASDKIVIEVQVARAALTAAAERVERTDEATKLAQRMQAAEQRLYEEGQGTLFNLNLREQQLAEAAADQVAAHLDFYVALANYSAALGLEGELLMDGSGDRSGLILD